ncbi:MAG: D-tyrosyl-tRNA(Tyr) deacylase [Saprospiraceae bacterium]|nr:D-tyrosyl-tRNA(Tyr) deacylase [Saprospiraceae bacterium]
MKVVLQRVNNASVTIDEKVHSSIDRGLLILLGIEHEDEKADVDWLVSKIVGLRIFNDAEGKMNLSNDELNGEYLVVSQFTLHASTKKGNRPSYIKAARPEVAIPMYEYFIKHLATISQTNVKSGVFGADMKVSLTNDGPVTIIIDSKNKE